MKIAVCVKQVPDTWAEKVLRAGDATLDREAADGVMNEIDEYAVEAALQDTSVSLDLFKDLRASWNTVIGEEQRRLVPRALPAGSLASPAGKNKKNKIIKKNASGSRRAQV